MVVRSMVKGIAAVALLGALGVGCSSKAEQAATRSEDAARRSEAAASRVEAAAQRAEAAADKIERMMSKHMHK